MSTEELSQAILDVCTEANVPIPFRKIEARLVLKDVDVCTYDIQRAVSFLVMTGALIEDAQFHYTNAGTTSTTK